MIDPAVRRQTGGMGPADVIHLHALKERLDAMLTREGRMELAAACFDFLPQRALLDVAGWQDIDVFDHGP